MERQHLIFDADDTLWENNIYFEEAFDQFCAYLNHSRLSPDEIRAVLDEIEIENNKIHGYGSINFGRNLSQCFLHLAERAVEEHDLKRVTALAHDILDREIELREGVAETLPYLAEKHELTLFTKGDPKEQATKIERSGLAPFFLHCEIVKEKNRDAYLRLADIRGFNLEWTWMIGNSPKSDINPSLAAGMNAVWIPHERTWTLEREEVRPSPSGRLRVVEKFADLLDLFS
ncbi:MAG TPA: HAD hydrolase-like protein [Bryobacteraceae bacterium]|nr:HAD hydrolase-like protein [Bryobacteraceae bacterium]